MACCSTYRSCYSTHELPPLHVSTQRFAHQIAVQVLVPKPQKIEFLKEPFFFLARPEAHGEPVFGISRGLESVSLILFSPLFEQRRHRSDSSRNSDGFEQARQ